jgi:hypothetical protein
MMISLFKLTSIYINSIFLSEMPFSNNQMVNTRSGGGQDVPPIVRAHIANQQNPVPPPPPNPAIDPATQQFFAAEMQLIQNLTATVQNVQAQQNQPHPPPPAPPTPRDKHKEFMCHHPPTYSHSIDPLDNDDWLKTITKKLERAQCNDREMVLYASGQLEGLASDWCDAYTAAHPAPNTITWQQFKDAFRAHHIHDRVLKLK